MIHWAERKSPSFAVEPSALANSCASEDPACVSAIRTLEVAASVVQVNVSQAGTKISQSAEPRSLDWMEVNVLGGTF